jgi:hypothetical protein
MSPPTKIQRAFLAGVRYGYRRGRKETGRSIDELVEELEEPHTEIRTEMADDEAVPDIPGTLRYAAQCSAAPLHSVTALLAWDGLGTNVPRQPLSESSLDSTTDTDERDRG